MQLELACKCTAAGNSVQCRRHCKQLMKVNPRGGTCPGLSPAFPVRAYRYRYACYGCRPMCQTLTASTKRA